MTGSYAESLFIRFDCDLYVRAFPLIDGQEILDAKENPQAPGALHLETLSAALVYDNSYFGATSPILGQTYLLELSSKIGSITYYDVLADYRRYFMPVRPWTLVFRFLTFGRFGPGAEDDRLYPLFLGY